MNEESILAQAAVLEKLATAERVAPYLLMRAWMALDQETACDYLELACAERDPRLTHCAVSPVFDVLRGEPRFESMLRSMRLAAEPVLT